MTLHAGTPALRDVSVVVPVHNESANIAALVAEIDAALAEKTVYEIICVDDGSSDGTPEVLRALKSGYPRLRVLRHEVNCGQSTATRSGIRAARHAWIATLDGDGQNDPADIPRLLERVAQDPSVVVIGVRAKRRDSTLRRLSSRIANGVRGTLLNDGSTDTGCGLKVFARDAFLELPHFDHMHRFLPALFRARGASIVSVPVNHRPRLGGRSHYGIANRLWAGIVDILGVIWLRRRTRLPKTSEI